MSPTTASRNRRVQRDLAIVAVLAFIVAIISAVSLAGAAAAAEVPSTEIATAESTSAPTDPALGAGDVAVAEVAPVDVAPIDEAPVEAVDETPRPQPDADADADAEAETEAPPPVDAPPADGIDADSVALAEGKDPQQADENLPPVAVDDYFEVTQDTLLVVHPHGVTDNDTDPNFDWFQFYDRLPASTGEVLTHDAYGGFEYQPAAGFTGTATFAYRVKDEHGALSNYATATIVVKPTGEPVKLQPALADDEYLYAKATPVYIAAPGVLANDDVHGDEAIVSLQFIPNLVTYGTVTVYADGSFLFTPPSVNGLYWFDYRVCTVGGCAVATVTLLPTQPGQVPSGPTSPEGPIGHAPAANADTASVVAGETKAFASPGVLANDTDADGDALQVLWHTDPAHGKLTIAGDGSYVYTAEAGFVGGVDAEYTIFDGEHAAKATLHIEVHAPLVGEEKVDAVDDFYAFTLGADAGGNELHVGPPGIFGNDIVPAGANLSVISATNPAHGVVHGEPDGSFVYIADAGFVGTDTFEYEISDGVSTDTATVHITVESDTETPGGLDGGGTPTPSAPGAPGAGAGPAASDPSTTGLAQTGGESTGVLVFALIALTMGAALVSIRHRALRD